MTAISQTCAGATGRAVKRRRAPIHHLFLFIGADPNTGWLAQCDIALDGKGFVRTGGDCEAGHHALETSRTGVFAIGDVRSGSVKRVAAAVGEGAQVVAALHAYLAQPAAIHPRRLAGCDGKRMRAHRRASGMSRPAPLAARSV